MLGDYIYDKASAAYEKRVLLIDEEGLEDIVHYSRVFSTYGFACVKYEDDLAFRIEHEESLPDMDYKLAVFADSRSYIPYDILKKFAVYKVSLHRLFPKMHLAVLSKFPKDHLDLLCLAYKENYDDLASISAAERFIKEKVFSSGMIKRLLTYRHAALERQTAGVSNYKDWFLVAETKAAIDVMAAQYKIELDTSDINISFRDWLLNRFGKLSTELNHTSPVLVSRAMEYMREHSDKFVIVVMDCMSEFDWRILSRSFSDIRCEQTAAFAMIPTVTSISRQCLLSNKFPMQLLNPWSQSKEKAEFTACAKEMGFSDGQIGYERGYDAQFSPLIRCGAIIINDIDDMVHGQTQGRLGMYNDVELLARQGKLASLTKRLLRQGFDVYISADHGNTPCTGMGKLVGTGVETKTKSRRMLVLQGYSQRDTIREKYHLIEFPKFYLMREYDYLICDVGTSFDVKEEDVMNHGGITLDEVVVPFIKIKAENNNG